MATNPASKASAVDSIEVNKEKIWDQLDEVVSTCMSNRAADYYQSLIFVKNIFDINQVELNGFHAFYLIFCPFSAKCFDLLCKLEENMGSIGYSIGAVDDWVGVG